MTENNIISWFEIPATDIDRAQKFYEHVFNITMHAVQLPHEMRIFPLTNPLHTCGAICRKEAFYIPSETGVLVYLNSNPDMISLLERVVQTGGKILVQRTFISPENGYIAIINDSEGNRIGLHSNR